MPDSKTVRTLALPSRVDDEAAVVLKANLIKFINEGARKIICDFSATEFLSPEGAEELVNVARFLTKTDGELGICRIRTEVKSAIPQPQLFKFYSVEESVAVVALKNLVTYFEYYENILDLKVRMENDIAHIEIYLEFAASETMQEVQQTVNLIRHSLEHEIKDARVLIIPSTPLEDETPLLVPAIQRQQIVYSSGSESVKQLAQAIEQTVQKDIACTAIKSATPEEQFDLLSVVLWVDQGSANPESASFLKNLHNQKLAIFTVMQNYPYSGYAGECMKNITALLDSSNTVVGRFACQLKDGELVETEIMRACNKYFDIIHDTI
ncbi:MAG: hypothetical protein H6Q72_2191 [Firmicutes bacterium]|nr:hypothetical protein [Bacillota bacterium]